MNNIIYELKKGKGFVKEYYDNSKLRFEGEYLNGKKNWKGKEYYAKGNLKFDGEYLYNYNIKGKLYIKEKVEFEGEFLF